MRLVQLKHTKEGRRIAVVQDAQLQLLCTFCSIYDLALAAIGSGKRLTETASTNFSKIGVPPEWFYKLSGFGRPLRNPVRIDRSTQACIRVDQLG